MSEVERQADQHKVPAKKVPAKKVAAKKVAAKKVAAKKVAAKKVAAKKVAAKKVAAKKVAAEPFLSSTRELEPPSSDPVVILSLTEPFSRKELQKAWRSWASEHHPDRGGDASLFARGQRAYQTLLARFL